MKNPTQNFILDKIQFLIGFKFSMNTIVFLPRTFESKIHFRKIGNESLKLSFQDTLSTDHRGQSNGREIPVCNVDPMIYLNGWFVNAEA